MHTIVGLLLLVIALGAMFYMIQAGVFQPVTGIFSDVITGYDQSYGGSGATTNVSPAYHYVRIGFVALTPTSTISTSGTAVSAGEVDLVAHPKNGGLTLTGWVISTEKGKFKIPAVVNLYSPSVAGVPPEKIFVRDGDRIRIYTGKSPTGQNERITQSEYRIWLGDFLPAAHGTVVLRDQDGLEVDRYAY